MIETNTQEPITTRDLVEKNAAATQQSRDDQKAVALFAADEAQALHSRWEKIQIAFVDQPRDSVQHADELVATVIKRLAEIFAEERARLEHEWGQGDNVSTEDLRVSLRRYRSLFDRLLGV